jgi:hypothetical protein
MAQIFLSHASEDARVAREVAEAFTARGIAVWMAPDSILPGQVYNEAIVSGLRASDALCVLVSTPANGSKHVAREVALADDLGKRIVPIRIEAVEPSDGLVYYLNLPQWVEWGAHGAAGLGPVIALLTGAPGPDPAPPPLSEPAAPHGGLGAGGGALVRVVRPKLYSAMARNVAILVDGDKRGEVGNGGALDVQVSPGPHEFMARMDYIKSAPFRIDAEAGRTRIAQISLPNSTDLGGQAAGLFGGASYFTWALLE